MKKVYNLKKELPFSENISSITSISLDTTFNETKEGFEGKFLVEGNYKTHELSLNKKEFKYDIDFKEEIDALEEGSLNLEVEDFTYELEDNNLVIYIDYNVTYDEEKNDDEFNEEEFERFLEDHEVDIVNLNNNEEQNEIKLVQEIKEEPEEINEEDEDEEVEEKEPEEMDTQENLERDVTITPNVDESDATEVILKTIDKEEKYITYHVYVCEEDDTFESISEKFKTTKEEIREYNDIADIEYGRKIIIPVKDE